MGEVYPRIDPPHKQPDGSYIIRIHSGPGKVREVPAADLKAARATIRALEQAAEILIPPPEPPLPARVGRPLRLTPEIRRRVVEGFSAMMTMDMIAARAGISERSLYRWLEEGERAAATLENEGDDYEESADDRERREFWQACKEASSELQWKLCQYVIASGKREWTAAMTFLERRWGGDFGRRMIKVEGEREPITVVFRRPPMDPNAPSDSIETGNGVTHGAPPPKIEQ